MRLVFASSERFSGCIVKALLAAGHEVVAVFSPARGIFRRQGLSPKRLIYQARGWDLGKVCRAHDIPVRINHRLDEGSVTAYLRGVKADALLVLGWPTMIQSKTLDLFRYGGVNIHPSMLPKLRGADPLFDIIDKDLPDLGVTFHKLTETLDAGPIVLQAKVTRKPSDTYERLYFKVIAAIREQAPRAIRQLGQNPDGTPQQGEPTTASRFRAVLRVIDPSWDAMRLVRRGRACYSHHNLVTAYKEKLIFCKRCSPARVSVEGKPEPGTVVGHGWFSVIIQTAAGQVRLRGLRFQGSPLLATPVTVRARLPLGSRIAPLQETKRLFLASRRRARGGRGAKPRPA